MGVVIVTVFFRSFLFNINRPLSRDHSDAFLTAFILKHYMGVFTTGDWANITNLPMFHGFGNSLFFTDIHVVHALTAFPIFLLTRDIIAASNVVVFLTIMASFLASYLLSWHLTASVLPSLIGAVIVILNPFMMSRFPDQLIVLSIQWLILIFLSFEKALTLFQRQDRARAGRFLFLMFVFLSIQILGATFYYSVFMTVMLPLYCGIRLRQEKAGFRSFFATRPVFIGASIFLLTALWTAALYWQAHRDELPTRSKELTELFSAWPSDWLFATPNNWLYGGLKTRAANAFPSLVTIGFDAEQNLFPGIVPLALLAASFWILGRSDLSTKRLYAALVILAAAGFLLSLGPAIQVSGITTIPGPYRLIQWINPLFSFIRAPARFAVFVFLALGLVSAMTLTQLGKQWSTWTRRAVLGIVLVLVLLEYWTTPPSFMDIPPETRAFYQRLEENTHISTIVDLPLANRLPLSFRLTSRAFRSEVFDATYLLWASVFHNKTLFSGYSGFIPREYLERTSFLTLIMPSPAGLNLLRSWGVDAIVLHKDEFKDTSEFDSMRAGLIHLKIPVLAETDTLALFDLTVSSGR